MHLDNGGQRHILKNRQLKNMLLGQTLSDGIMDLNDCKPKAFWNPLNMPPVLLVLEIFLGKGRAMIHLIIHYNPPDQSTLSYPSTQGP